MKWLISPTASGRSSSKVSYKYLMTPYERVNHNPNLSTGNGPTGSVKGDWLPKGLIPDPLIEEGFGPSAIPLDYK